jgi:hypothetical protein
MRKKLIFDAFAPFSLNNQRKKTYSFLPFFTWTHHNRAGVVIVEEENDKEMRRSHSTLFTYMDKKLVEVLREQIINRLLKR